MSAIPSQPIEPSKDFGVSRRTPIGRIWRLLGPGFITGASDDDPSGIGTYAIAGASFGFATLWTALITFPMMAAVQIHLRENRDCRG